MEEKNQTDENLNEADPLPTDISKEEQKPKPGSGSDHATNYEDGSSRVYIPPGSSTNYGGKKGTVSP